MEPNEARKTSDVPENKPWIRNQWFQEKEMQEMGGWEGWEDLCVSRAGEGCRGWEGFGKVVEGSLNRGKERIN